jgi:hypothetical protein
MVKCLAEEQTGMLCDSTRDLFWLITLVGTVIALGGRWLSESREQSNSRFWKTAAESLAGELERQGYDIELVENRKIGISRNRPAISK